ncbi:MAG: bifunctional nuclease domain-containing protein [Thermoplasmatota archaeon]
MDESLIACEVMNVYLADEGATVVLDPGRDTLVPIQVSSEQGRSIQLGLWGEKFFRPLTHDLMVNILDEQGLEIESLVIHGLIGSTITAELHLRKNDKRYSYDVRPSDGIALVLRTGSKIMITDELIESIGVNVEYWYSKHEKERLPIESLDIIEAENYIEVIAELPNVEKEEDIEIELFPNSIKLNAKTTEGGFDRTMSLPKEIEKEIEELSFTNKILELKLKKKG